MIIDSIYSLYQSFYGEVVSITLTPDGMLRLKEQLLTSIPESKTDELKVKSLRFGKPVAECMENPEYILGIKIIEEKK